MYSTGAPSSFSSWTHSSAGFPVTRGHRVTRVRVRASGAGSDVSGAGGEGRPAGRGRTCSRAPRPRNGTRGRTLRAAVPRRRAALPGPGRGRSGVRTRWRNGRMHPQAAAAQLDDRHAHGREDLKDVK